MPVDMANAHVEIATSLHLLQLFERMNSVHGPELAEDIARWDASLRGQTIWCCNHFYMTSTNQVGVVVCDAVQTRSRVMSMDRSLHRRIWFGYNTDGTRIVSGAEAHRRTSHAEPIGMPLRSAIERQSQKYCEIDLMTRLLNGWPARKDMKDVCMWRKISKRPLPLFVTSSHDVLRALLRELPPSRRAAP